MEWIVLDDAEAVARKARDEILNIAENAIAARGRFSIVLAGGTTPERSYALLAQSKSDWNHWHVYLGDERCLPVDNPERNSLMAARTLTDQVPIPPDQVHPIPAELGAKAAAQAYGKIIKDALPFDMVLLGMGEDGHTASLFPGHEHITDALALPVHNAPKPPPDRVSLSPKALGSCRELLFLITGAGKKTAVKQWKHGASLPIAGISTLGRARVLIDQAAIS
jgi:6-phosphogluconolactonase